MQLRIVNNCNRVFIRVHSVNGSNFDTFWCWFAQSPQLPCTAWPMTDSPPSLQHTQCPYEPLWPVLLPFSAGHVKRGARFISFITYRHSLVHCSVTRNLLLLPHPNELCITRSPLWPYLQWIRTSWASADSLYRITRSSSRVEIPTKADLWVIRTVPVILPGLIRISLYTYSRIGEQCRR